jgi:hypothetical protein
MGFTGWNMLIEGFSFDSWGVYLQPEFKIMIIGKSQLMESYGVSCLKTWNRLILPLSGKLRKHSKIYTPAEVKVIREWMEKGVIDNKCVDDGML